jgi:hypothetical protein
MSSAQGDVDQKPSMEDGYLGPIFDVRASTRSLRVLMKMTVYFKQPNYSFNRELKPYRLRRLTITCSRSLKFQVSLNQSRQRFPH